MKKASASQGDFCKQFEESSETAKTSGHDYVVQEHNARMLHYDLRLEMSGVLKSWALPKEPPTDTKAKRLAIQTEDHPLAYGNFEGIIPKDSYGAGTVKIWDKGNFEPIEAKDGKIVVKINGQKLKGTYCLIRLQQQDKNWLFFRKKEA